MGDEGAGTYHFERYELLSRLHGGRHGEVWRATPRGEPERLAILKLGVDELGRRCVAREVEALSMMAGADETTRETLPQLLDASVDSTPPFLVVREAQAPCLAVRVERRGKIAEANVGSMLADLLRALTHAHERGVIHGAISPACVFVDTGYNAMLADFGFGPIEGQQTSMETALADRDALAQRNPLPASGLDDAVFVADEFVAPEAREKGLIHPGTDLYAVGRVAAFALVGTTTRQSMEVLLERQGVSLALRRMVMNLADVDPYGRYNSAAEALAIVQTVTLQRTINASLGTLGSGALREEPERQATFARRVKKRRAAESDTKRRKLRAALVFLVLMALMAVPLVLAQVFLTDEEGEIVPLDVDRDAEEGVNDDEGASD